MDGYCDAEARCRDVTGGYYSSTAACKAALANYEPLYRALTGNSMQQDWDAHYKVDQGKLAGCLNYMKAAACGSVGQSDACKNIVIPKNPLSVGQVCSGSLADGKLCGTDAYCAEQEGNSDCQVCRALKSNGTACTSSGECLSGYCNPSAPSTCGAPPTTYKNKGEPCTYTSDCVEYLECAGSGSKTCQARLGANSACGVTGDSRPSCFADLWCMPDSSGNAGTCVAPLADGATCQRSGNGNYCQNLCVFTTKDSAEGTCRRQDSLPGDGQPCAGLMDFGAAFCKVDDATYANFTFDMTTYEYTSCECRNTVANGQPCILSNACSEGRCDGTDFSTTPPTAGICAARYENGHECSTSDDCVSAHCGGTPGTKTCAAALTCP